VTELAALNVKITGDAGDLKAAMSVATTAIESASRSMTEMQRTANAFAGVLGSVSKSAMDSARAFDTFDEAARQVDSLRASIDPLYASSKRYEAAISQLDNALSLGVIKQAEYARMSDRLARSMLGIGPRMAQAASSGGGFAQSMRGVSQQLSQVGQQTMATGNFVQALAIQLPDLGLAFGAVGAAAGLAAGIALPMLISAMTGAGAESEELKAHNEALKESIDAVTAATQKYQTARAMAASGATLEAEQALLSEINRLEAERLVLMAEAAQLQYADLDATSLQAAAERAANSEKQRALRISLAEIDAALERLNYERTLEVAARRRANEQRNAYREQKAETDRINSSASQLAAIVNASTAATNALSAAASSVANAFGAAYQNAQALASAMATGGGRGAGPGGPLVGSTELSELQAGGGVFRNYVAPSIGGGSGGGGGGGVSRDYAGELEAFQETLMTETELEAAQFAQRQTLLQEFLSAKVVSLQEYQDYEQEIKAAHEAKMAEIEATAQQQRLSQTAGMFGALASIAQAGGQRMAKAAAAFQAIEGTVNAYGAAIKALNTPGLTPAGRFAAYASVLAAGLKGVASIRQAGGIGGGGAAGGVAQSAGPSQAPLDVRLTGINANDLFSGAQLGSLLDRLSATAGDRGYRLMVAA